LLSGHPSPGFLPALNTSENGGEVAEIRVEQKKPQVWIWIVALLVIALLAWLVYEMFITGNGVTLPGNNTPAGAVFLLF